MEQLQNAGGDTQKLRSASEVIIRARFLQGLVEDNLSHIIPLGRLAMQLDQRDMRHENYALDRERMAITAETAALAQLRHEQKLEWKRAAASQSQTDPPKDEGADKCG